MNVRNFSITRLHTLLKRVIMLITIIALLLGILVYRYTRSDISLDGVNFCDRLPHATIEEIESSGGYRDCVNREWEKVNDANNLWMRAIIIALGLPILFFGGTALIRYLFPTKITEGRN